MVTSSNGSQRWLSRAANPRARRPDALSRAIGLTSLALIACAAFGGCSSSSNGATDKFLGNWTFETGTLSAACTGLPPFSSSLIGETVTLMKGTSSDLASTLTTSMGTCMLKLTVSGTMATADAGQSCTFNVTAGGLTVPVTVNINSWTVTTTDGMTMTTNATATGSGGLADGCPVTLGGSATKHAGDASAG
jgi:hypothetical protein